MSERLLISVDPGMIRVARTIDGRAHFYRCLRRDQPSLVGNVYLGRVVRVVPPLNAAFVDCGLARDGFLSGDDAPGEAGRIENRCHEGEALAVQVVRDPVAGKGARVSAHLGLAGRFLVYRPGGHGVMLSRRIADEDTRDRLSAAAMRMLRSQPGGVIVRTAAATAAATDVEADLDYLIDAAAAIEDTRAGTAVPSLLRREIGPVERVLRDFADDALASIVIDDGGGGSCAVRYAERFAPGLAERLARHAGPTPLFDAEGIAEDIESLLDRRVPLANGGALTIERTEAMCTIDVDSAGFTERASGRGALPLNLAAAEEAARQLRLRNIGGLIAIDFAGMAAASDGDAVVRALRQAMRRDPAPVRIASMSPFGVVELTRRRAGASLAEVLTEACPACEGGGRRKTAFAVACEIARACLAETAARPGGRLVVRAAPAVIDELESPLGDAVDAVCDVEYRDDPTRARDTFDVAVEDGR